MSEGQRDKVTAYGGIPYAEGSLFGVRAFRVDPIGRLVASTRAEVWEPGENIARHDGIDPEGKVARSEQISKAKARTSREAIRLAGAEGKAGARANEMIQSVSHGRGFHPAVEFVWNVTWLEDAADHSPAACDSCGFHGFTEPDARDYERHYGPSVVGVIEGYGKLTHGKRGFRAEKAKIVGLLDPSGANTAAAGRTRFARAMWWLARHPGVRMFWMFVALFVVVGNAFAGRFDVVPDAVTVAVALALGTLLIGNAVFSVIPPSRVVKKWGPPGADWLPNRRRPYYEPADDAREDDPVKRAEMAERFELVKRNYPDVEIFTSREEMTKKFGVAPVPPPPPPTPFTTDGFWSLPVESLD